MSKATRSVVILGFAVVALFGVDVAAGADDPWSQVTKEVEERVGVAPEQMGPGETSEALIQKLLADGLTREEAVRIALINNAQLQAAFNELGIARADLVEAGLYANPDLEAILRFPEAERGSELEVELSLSLSDLWRVPVRRKVARATLEQTTMEVVNQVLNTAADARQAHAECVLLTALQDKSSQVLETARTWRDHVYERYDYGYSSQLDLSMLDGAVASHEMEVEMTKAQLSIAGTRLSRVLGLSAEGLLGVVVVGTLPHAPTAAPDLPRLTQRAQQSRPDLLAAQLGVSAAEQDLRLQRRSKWQHVSVGPTYAREPSGEELWGLALGVELPLFDTKRAARQRVGYRLQQAHNELNALQATVQEEVTVAWEQLNLALLRERILREQVLPARQKAYDHDRKYYNEMQLNMLYMLEAQRELFEAQLAHIQALGDIEAAQVKLEFVVGRRTPID